MKCGVVPQCQEAAVGIQRLLWNRGTARANKERKAAIEYSRRQLVPDSEAQRARMARLQQTKSNRTRVRNLVEAVTTRYREVKNDMIQGLISKETFEKNYAQVSEQIKLYRKEWLSEQKVIESQYEAMLQRQK